MLIATFLAFVMTCVPALQSNTVFSLMRVTNTIVAVWDFNAQPHSLISFTSHRHAHILPQNGCLCSTYKMTRNQTMAMHCEHHC